MDWIIVTLLVIIVLLTLALGLCYLLMTRVSKSVDRVAKAVEDLPVMPISVDDEQQQPSLDAQPMLDEILDLGAEDGRPGMQFKWEVYRAEGLYFCSNAPNWISASRAADEYVKSLHEREPITPGSTLTTFPRGNKVFYIEDAS